MSGLKKASSIEGLRAAAAGSAPVAAPVSVADDQVPAVVKPVRLNADIDRELHRWLKSFALQADTDMAHVVRALLTELQTDEVLADRVRSRLG